MKTTKKREVGKLGIVHPNSCGIDIGSKFHMVAIGLEDGDVYRFGVYTKDHEKLIAFLKVKKVMHIAMESTGSYWQTLFSALQTAGFRVILVDGRQTKSLRKKTDVKDARAIYQLHTLGLLTGCFLPDQVTEKIRVYYRHRHNLIQESSRLTNRMQQAMRLMNIRLDNVLSDIMGQSGRRIIESIISGQTDPIFLSKLANKRVQKTSIEIQNSLQGHWKEEQIFVLKDCYEAFLQLQGRILQIDNKIKQILEEVPRYGVPPQGITKKSVRKNQINIGLEQLSYSYYGVDLFAIPSVSFNLVMSLISEIGFGIDKFSTSKEFSSYLRLAPNNKISGGRKISGRTPKGKSPLAIAFRNAANTITKQKSSSPLLSFFQRKAVQKGRSAAITATARKLATIMWHMIVHNEQYTPVQYEAYRKQIKRKAIINIKKKMKRLGIEPHEFIAA